MAEAAISAALSKLGELAMSEAKILMEVGDNMTLLRDRLEWLQAFIRDADRRRRASTDDQLTRVWVRQTRTVSFQAEDALDEFIYQVSSSTYTCNLAGVLRRFRIENQWLYYCMMQIEGGDVERQLRLRPHKPPPAAPASGRHRRCSLSSGGSGAENLSCSQRISSLSPSTVSPFFPVLTWSLCRGPYVLYRIGGAADADGDMAVRVRGTRTRCISTLVPHVGLSCSCP
jgi:hypothetical protein